MFCDNGQMNKYSEELLTIIEKIVSENPIQRPNINEIYEKAYFREYYSYYLIKYNKYSSIFSCFNCLFNYQIWTKIIKNNKKIQNKYLKSFLTLFIKLNKDEFEKNVGEFKREYLKKYSKIIKNFKK